MVAAKPAREYASVKGAVDDAAWALINHMRNKEHRPFRYIAKQFNISVSTAKRTVGSVRPPWAKASRQPCGRRTRPRPAARNPRDCPANDDPRRQSLREDEDQGACHRR